MTEQIAELKSRIAMPDLLARLGFNVTGKKGNIRCILHNDQKTASFTYNNDLFYCFGCKAGGDKIKLIQEANHCDFWTAIHYLEDITGFYIKRKRIKVGDSYPTKRQREKDEHIKKIEAIIKKQNDMSYWQFLYFDGYKDQIAEKIYFIRDLLNGLIGLHFKYEEILLTKHSLLCDEYEIAINEREKYIEKSEFAREVMNERRRLKREKENYVNWLASKLAAFIIQEYNKNNIHHKISH